MVRYIVGHNYTSNLGAFVEGSEVEINDDFAAHINRDSPGTLLPVNDAPKARAEDHPPHDRMIKTARKRGA